MIASPLVLATLTLVAADCITSSPAGAVNDAILSSVAAVEPPLSKLNSLVQQWQDSDGLMGALAIQSSYYPLYSAVMSLSSAVNPAPSIAPNDAGVYLSALNSLVGDISTLMGSLDAKANAFAGVGAAQIVVGDITSLAGPASAIEASLFAALPTNVPCVFQASAASVASQFSGAFASAAATYTIKAGIPVFPTAPSACLDYCAAAPTSSPPATTSAPPVTSSAAPTTSPDAPTTSPSAPTTSKVVTTSSAPPAPSVSTPTSTKAAPTTTPTSAVQPLVNDVNNLIASLNNLDGIVKNFKHSFFKDIVPLIKLQNTAVDLGSQIQSVTKDFNSTSQLSPADTLTIATPFTNLITPIKNVLSDIGAKKPEFDKAILNFIPVSGLIKGHIVHLKQVSDALIAQVRLTIYPAFGGVVDPLAQQIDAAFDAQINGVYKNVPTIYVPIKLFG